MNVNQMSLKQQLGKVRDRVARHKPTLLGLACLLAFAILVQFGQALVGLFVAAALVALAGRRGGSDSSFKQSEWHTGGIDGELFDNHPAMDPSHPDYLAWHGTYSSSKKKH